MLGPEGDISERARLRFEVWKAIQEKKMGDTTDFDRLALVLPRNQMLGYLIELTLRRPDYLQGGVTDFVRDFPFPEDGLLNPVGVGAFIQIYMDEATGYNDRVRYKGKRLSPEQYKDWWCEEGFRHLGNSDEETRQLLQWMQEYQRKWLSVLVENGNLLEDIQKNF